MKNASIKRTVNLVFCFAIAVAMIVAVAVFGLFSGLSSSSAYADEFFYVSDSFDAYVNELPSETGIYSQTIPEGEGGAPVEVNMLKISIDSSDWIATLLDNDAIGVIGLKRNIEIVTYDPKSGEPTYMTCEESVNVVSKNATLPSSGSYAVLQSATMTGTNYRGESVSTDIYSLTEAGVYKMTSATVYYDFKPLTSWGDNTVSNVPATTGTSTVNMSKFNFVLTSQITLDSVQLSAYKNNFGLSDEIRSYSGSNLRELIKIHKDGGVSSSDACFYFSATDRNFVKSIGNGFGTDYASNSNTNLEKLSPYLNVAWYKKIDFGAGAFTYEKENSAVLLDAGTYAIRLECSHNFDYSAFSPIFVTLGGSEEFGYDITINRAKLKLDISGAVGLTVRTSKPYDGNVDAKNMFGNVPMTSEIWSAISGVPSDASAVEGADLFNFDGTVFDDRTIGENKTVYMTVEMLPVDDLTSARYKISKNYIPVPYLDGTECVLTAKGYNIGNGFAITPNELTLKFSAGPDEDGKPLFPSSITYGDYMNARNFSFENYIVMTGATESGTQGIFLVDEHPDWRIVIGEPDSGGSSVLNTLYITVNSALRDNENSNPSFTDVYGNKYTTYGGRFYYGQYFFIYNAQIRYVGGATGNASLTDGVLSVPSSDGGVKFKISFGSLQSLNVLKKSVTVSIDDITLEKDYDGTDVIDGVAASADGIIAEDNGTVVDFYYNVRYSYAGAGNNVPVSFEFDLLKHAGTIDSVYNNTKNSYEIDSVNIGNNTSYADITRGTIRPALLTAEFETNGMVYSRKYMTNMYVAVTGLGIPEGYCYYYIWSGSEGNKQGGYCREEQLAERYNGCVYVKIKLSGFFGNEAFGYPDNGYEDFMTIKTSSNPSDYAPITLNAYDLLSWHDSIKNVDINFDTDSSQNGEKYRLEINDGFLLSNYKLTMKSDSYAYLIIEKRELSNEINIIEDNSSNRMEYNGASHLEQLFDVNKGKVSITSHPEYTQLTNVTSFISVSSFSTDCEESGHAHNFNEDEINRLVLSGSYDLVLTIPETKNYKSFTVPFSVTVNPKEVQVYLTFAMRMYGDKEIEYNAYRYITDINDHVVYVNSDGELVGADEGGNRVYAYDTSNINGGNYILYCGFIGSDTINISDAEQKNATAWVELPGGIDAAGHDGKVRADGAVKHNYSFSYNETTLFVKRKPLSLTVEANQTKDYTGGQTVIDYEISGGPGALGMYVIGYTPTIGEEPVRDVDEDETKTDVIQSGEYILKVYAKPDGPDANNYAVSEERFEVRLTLNKIRITLLPGAGVAETVYTGNEEGYSLLNFNDYFTGKGADDRDIPAETLWGTVSIASAVSDKGETVSKIIDAGTYTVTVKANIANAANVFFESTDSSISYVDSVNCTFTVILTVEKSSDYSFAVTKSESILLKNDIFSMVYSGYSDESETNTIAFGYNLAFAGKEMNNGELNVVIAVDGVLYAINTRKFMKNVASDVLDANSVASKISGISYDITERHSLLNAGVYEIKYYINNEDSEGYNPNFISFEKVYTFEIEKKALKVYMVFDESDFDEEYKEFIPYKIYKTPNEELGEKIKYRFEGFVRNEGEDEDLVAGIQGIKIDWSEAPENATVNSDCRIKTSDGIAPENYYLDHSATVVLKILPAESKIVVYGEGDFDKRGDGFKENLVYEFDKIYEYETITDEEAGTETRKVVHYENFDADRENNPVLAVGRAINQYFYYDYTVYSGKIIVPKVLRMAGEEPINEYEESVGTDGVKIRFAGLFVGNDKNNITASDIVEYDACLDVGEYVFAVSVVASQNYKPVPEKYYYLKVVKNKLTIEVVSQSVSKVYDGKYEYPTYNVRYIGFVGIDDEYPKYKNEFPISHISTYSPTSVTGITELGLIHPYYEITDNITNQALTPLNVGEYKVGLLFSDVYGISKNYDISVSADALSPVLKITARPVGVVAGSNVQKTYDAKDSVPEGLIKEGNYIFCPVDGVEQSGVVEGDAIELVLNWRKSRFERINVKDDEGNQSIVKIKAYYNQETVLSNGNYVLSLSESEYHEDEDGTYIVLNGIIVPASVEVQFYSDSLMTKRIDAKYETTYDAKPHEIYPLVRGVQLEYGVYESVAYILTYKCERIHYDSQNPPSLAESYQVQLVVDDSNYVAAQRGIELVINKAEVDIIFGGDSVQIYGAVNGLTAIAKKDFGDEIYSKSLSLKYYDSDGNTITDISVADAGGYRVVAVHEESANFKYCEKETTFDIGRRGVHINVDVNSSYRYTGRNVDVDFYFDYNGITFRPQLVFFRGEEQLTQYPINVGDYKVRVDNTLKNFDILDDYSVPFSITPVSVTVKPVDLTVTLGQTFDVQFAVSGSVNNEKVNQVFEALPSVEYYTVTGEKTNPDKVGMYRMLAYGGASGNYIPVYDFGILNINKPVVSQSVTDSRYSATGEVVVEGSFGADVSLIIKTTDTLEYNRYVTAFESAALADETLANLSVFDVYYLKLSNGSITDSNNGNMLVKIYAKYYFDRLGADETQYSVARISSDGTVTLLDAEREGDYLLIRTDSLEAFAMLVRDDGTINKSSDDYGWVLYVGIAIGVVLIAAALIIVKVRA